MGLCNTNTMSSQPELIYFGGPGRAEH